MSLWRAILKPLIKKSLSPRLQRKARHYYLSRQTISGSGLQEIELPMLKQLIHVGDTAADLGANIGVYTKELSSLVGEQGNVLAFEPIPENFEILQTVVNLGQLKNVKLWNKALGATHESRTMAIPDSDGYSGFYRAHVLEKGRTDQGVTVEILTLDDLWKEGSIQTLHFIKCDVEGGEWEVIQGGKELIRKLLPTWFIEVSLKTSGPVFQFFQDLGYQAFVYNQQLVQVDGFRDKEYSNYFFIHPHSKSWGSQLPNHKA